MRTAGTVQRDVADSPTEVAGTRRGRRGSRQGEARWWSQMAGPWGTVDTEGTFFVPGVTEAQGSPLSLAASGGGWSDLHFEKMPRLCLIYLKAASTPTSQHREA